MEESLLIRSMEDLKTLYQRVKTETNPQRKGELLEELAKTLFESILKLKLIGRNERSFREIDLRFALSDSETMLLHRQCILVECKNMEKVGTPELGQLESALLHGRLFKLGVLFTTGRLTRDAIRNIADFNRQSIDKYGFEGPMIVYIDDEDLKEMFESRISFKELFQKIQERALKQILVP